MLSWSQMKKVLEGEKNDQPWHMSIKQQNTNYILIQGLGKIIKQNGGQSLVIPETFPLVYLLVNSVGFSTDDPASGFPSCA